MKVILVQDLFTEKDDWSVYRIDNSAPNKLGAMYISGVSEETARYICNHRGHEIIETRPEKKPGG